MINIDRCDKLCVGLKSEMAHLKHTYTFVLFKSEWTNDLHYSMYQHINVRIYYDYVTYGY